MNKKPEIIDYNLDQGKINLVTNINAWLHKKEERLDRAPMFLTILITLVTFLFILIYNNFENILLIVVAFLFYGYFACIVLYWILKGLLKDSKLFNSFLEKQKNKYIISQNITTSEYNLWDINYSKFKSDLDTFERKEDQTKLNTFVRVLDNFIEYLKYKRDYNLIYSIHTKYSETLKQLDIAKTNSKFYWYEYREKLKYYRAKENWIIDKENNSLIGYVNTATNQNNNSQTTDASPLKEINSDETIKSNLAINETKNASTQVNGDSSKTSLSIPDKEELDFELIENLEDIFAPNIEDEIVFGENNNTDTDNETQYKKRPKEDYIENAIVKKEIGIEGELFVLNYEKNKLKRKGQEALANKVKHLSIENDGYGFDILSFDENGNEKYIEVKTTVQDLNTIFYMSENEYKKAKEIKNYFIYRVFNFDLETKKGNIYAIDTSKQLDTYFKASPTNYKLTPTRF